MKNGIYTPSLKEGAFMEMCHVPSPELGRKHRGKGSSSDEDSGCGIATPNPAHPSLYKPPLRAGLMPSQILYSTATGVTPVTWTALVFSSNKSLRLS